AFGRARRATHENARAVAPVDLGIDVLENHHAAIEGHDLSVLRPRRAPGRTDVVFTDRAALEPQLLQLAGIREIHHDPAIGALADHVGLLALSAGVRFGARAILRLMVGGVSPPADDLGRPHAGRNFRFRRPGRSDRGPLSCAAARGCQCRQYDQRPTETAIPHRRFPLVLSAAPAEAQPRPTPRHLYRAQGLTTWNRPRRTSADPIRATL